jgi:hypothetical protein
MLADFGIGTLDRLWPWRGRDASLGGSVSVVRRNDQQASPWLPQLAGSS